MSDPKPQRVRRQRRRNRKKNLDVKVEVSQGPKNNKNRGRRRRSRRTHVVFETPNGQRAMDFVDLPMRAVRRVERRVRKLAGKVSGPRAESSISTSLTLGPVNGARTDDLSKVYRYWLAPCLLKPADSGHNSTPLTMRGSQYNLYRIDSLTVTVKPLVGNANVTGTLIILDLDLDSPSAKPDSIDSVKARQHKEVPVGASAVWRINPKYLEGPKEGWWLTDTNENPAMTLGPALNISTFMTTYNLLSVGGGTSVHETNYYSGPLALVEMTVKYSFANYEPKPALANMTRVNYDLEKQDAMRLVNLTDGSVAIETKKASKLAQIFNSAYKLTRESQSNDSQKSADIWAVVSDVVRVVAPALGPWSWLLEGGWFCIRHIVGALAAGFDLQNNSYYVVYASLEDAQKDIPIRVHVNTGPRADGNFPKGRYHFVQLTSDNLQWSGEESAVAAEAGPVIVYNDYLPLAHSEPPHYIPYPLYSFGNEGGAPVYSAGMQGVNIPPNGVSGYVDGSLCATGWGYWRFCTGKTAEDQFWIKGESLGNEVPEDRYFRIAPFNGKHLHLSYFELDDRLVLFGSSDFRDYGNYHTGKSMMAALERYYYESKKNYVEAPQAFFIRMKTWGGSPEWTSWVHSEEFFGSFTVMMPMKLCNGKIAIVYRGQDSIGAAKDPYVENMGADALLLFNITNKKIGLFFATDIQPDSFRTTLSLLWATNIQVSSRWRERMTLWHTSDETPLEQRLEPIPESDFELCTDDEGPRRIPTPPPLPQKRRKK
ncbi:capsid precursor [Passerine astrovirus 2]|nr:capsid precursor [Passerine astrovirus 2]